MADVKVGMVIGWDRDSDGLVVGPLVVPLGQCTPGHWCNEIEDPRWATYPEVTFTEVYPTRAEALVARTELLARVHRCWDGLGRRPAEAEASR